ncbi:unnamed protein product [Discula destructiva]
MFEVLKIASKLLRTPISTPVTDAAAAAGIVPMIVLTMKMLVAVAARAKGNAKICRGIISRYVQDGGLLSEGRIQGRARSSGLLANDSRTPERHFTRAPHKSTHTRRSVRKQSGYSKAIALWALALMPVGFAAPGPLNSKAENVVDCASVKLRLTRESPIENTESLSAGAKVLIAACVLIPAVCLVVVFYSQALRGKLWAIWKDNPFAFRRQHLRETRTHHEDSSMEGHEMSDHATVCATDGDAIRAVVLDVGPRPKWRFCNFRFHQLLSPNLVRTGGLGDEHVLVVSVPSSVEERGRAVVDVGSLFEDETWNRPDAIDDQDL